VPKKDDIKKMLVETEAVWLVRASTAELTNSFDSQGKAIKYAVSINVPESQVVKCVKYHVNLYSDEILIANDEHYSDVQRKFIVAAVLRHVADRIDPQPVAQLGACMVSPEPEACLHLRMVPKGYDLN